MTRQSYEQRRRAGAFSWFVLSAIVACSSHSQTLPAFPGAEGFGAHASGGRYGDVYHVVNLSSSSTTPGSFSYGLNNAPATGRTIVFDVSGYIPVSGNLGLHQPNITIAGQTAPGDGVGLKGGTFWIEKTNVVIRHFRFRNGVSADCIDLSSAATNVILDHCDMLFSTDENFSSFGNPPENLTFQWSFNAWGLSPHSAGGLWYVKRATSHHSLWAHNHTRDPKALPTGLLDWVNNVTFDYGIGFIMADSTGTADYKANVENCYFICPPGNTRPYALSRAGVDSNGVPNFSLWLTNCLWDTDGDYILDGYDHGYSMVSVHPTNFFKMTNAIPRNGGIPVTKDPPLVAYKKILSQGGPLRLDANHSGRLRDEVATVLIDSLVNQQHQRFTSVANTGAGNGGYGTLASSRPPPDTDRDGMPDYWEITLGSDPNVDDHTNQVAAGAFIPNVPAGYTLLEEYLHFRATPHAFLETSTLGAPVTLDVDLRNYTRGFTNKLPVTYLLSNVSTGSVSLSGGCIAHVVPPTNHAGRASFDFTVTDGDGSTWTQPFLMLVSAVPLPRDLRWRGDGGSNFWDTNALSFLEVGETNPVGFRNGDRVTFDDGGPNTPFTRLAGELQPFEVFVNNTAKNFTFGGDGRLAAGASLIKSGAGTLTISNANSHTGGTVLDGGRIRLGNKLANGSALGTGSLTLKGAATLELYGAEAGDIDGSGLGTFASAIDIPADESGSVLAPFRHALASLVTGAGTFNLRVNGVRGDVSGNAAAFTGQINVTSRSGVSDFRIAAAAGYPGARLHLATNVLMYSRTTGGAVIPIGEFTADLGALVSAGAGSSQGTQNDVTWRVGGLHTDATNAASFQGTTRLIKQGTGTWTLSGTSTHTGTTTVSNGTLAVTGSLGASPVIVASNAVLTGNGILGAGVVLKSAGILAPAGTLTVSNQLALASATLQFELAASPAGPNDFIALSGGTLALTNSISVEFNLRDKYLSAGTYALVAGGAATVSSNFTLGHNLPVGTRQAFNLTANVPGELALVVAGEPGFLVWQGTSGSVWDDTTTNWLNGSFPDKYVRFDAVSFDDSATNGNVSLFGAVNPQSVTVSNVTRAYNFAGGPIIGTASFTKVGAGSLTLTASNSFSGGMFLDGGSVWLANDTANTCGVGAGPVIFNGGALTMYDNASTYNSSSWDVIVPAGQTGTLALDSRCDFFGALTGGGTLNLKVAWVRSTPYGDWSGFTGQLNVAPRSGGAEFRLVHQNGLPSASVFLSSNVTAYPTFNDGVIALGELGGGSGATLGPGNGSGTNPTWLVGGKNTSATFAGSICDVGVTRVIKAGGGVWTLSGSNSFSGGLVVSNGTVLVSNTTGSGTGSGMVKVLANATLGGTGVIAGPVDIEADATISPGTAVGRLTINNALTLAGDSVTFIELNKALGTNDVVVCGSAAFDGTLVVTNLGGSLAAGDAFQIFQATNSNGSFASIVGSPGPLMEWSFNPVTGVLSVLGTTPPPPSDFQTRITFPGYHRAEVLTNIPLLVVLGTNIPGFSYTLFCAPNAGDLRFTTTNGLTALDHEIETWNPSGDSRVWVRVPVLTSNTVILASWGNPVATNPPASTTNGATWSAGYVGVWHLNEPGGTDATAGGHVASFNDATVTKGIAGNAAAYNGTSQATQVPWHADFNLATTFEVQGWFKLAAADKPTAGNYRTLTSRELPADFNNRNWWIALRSDGKLWWKSSPGLDVTNSADVADGGWHCFAANHEGGSARLYVDGLLVGVDGTPGVASTPTAAVFFGSEDGTPRYYKGALDELRLSNVARSSNWVWAVHQNIASNGTFNSCSSVSGVVPPSPVLSGFHYGSGQLSFLVNGLAGYVYTVQASTNLVTWGTMLVTNPPAMPFAWTDTTATNFSQRFYRVLVAP